METFSYKRRVSRFIRSFSSKPKNFRWIEHDILATSGEPITQGQINWLCNVQRIKIILTLTENTLEENKLRIVGLQSYKHVPMADHSVPKYSEILSAVNYLQDNYGKAPILIHCYGGKGRTGVILGSFLAVKYNLTSDQAIGKVRAIWPKFIEKGQETAIKTFIDTIKLSK